MCAPTAPDGGGLGGTGGADAPTGAGGQQTGGTGGIGGDTMVGSCTGTPEYCVMYPTQTACQAVGCNWDNSTPIESCDGTGWPCSQFATKATCEYAGCTWLAGIPPAGSGGAVATGGRTSTGGITGAGGITSLGGITGLGGVTSLGGRIDGGPPSTGGISGRGGRTSTGGVTAAGGAGGTGGTTAITGPCGNGTLDPGEQCDCGANPANLPSGCKAPNGIFHGDGTGCARTCTKEPSCLGGGRTQACTTACGDGNIDAGEECDDGNPQGGDGCSSTCALEAGFTCSTQTAQDAQPCASGSGECLALSMIYRDFQGENGAAGGHPDFPFLGTKFGGTKPTTICVPISGGPSKGNDSTARCWGIVADSLLNGKPQPGPTKTCDCRFSDWSIGNSSRIPGRYTLAGNDSPLSDGSGSIQGGDAGSTVNTTSTGGPYTGILTGYTTSSPGGPIWKGTVPAYKDAASFNQWFSDDPAVNKTFTGTLELATIGSNIYQYASKAHLAQGGFYPLDTLNPSQVTLCNLWPYWNHGNGQPFWGSCSGDQYLFIPRVTASDCPVGDTVDDGCWVSVAGARHDNYFTDEARYYFVYDSINGISISFYGDDDLFVFINGVLVLDLGGIHQQLPGKVTVHGDPGDAKVLEGGCVDSGGNQVGATAGSTVCSPANASPKLPAATPADFRDRTVKLGLENGKVYELAIFGADRHPPESNFQLTLQGFAKKRSSCSPN